MTIPQSNRKQKELAFGPLPLLRSENVVSRPSVLRSLKPTIVFDTYWRFASERQEIFLRRAMGQSLPWTDDPILREYRFTNVYRASDRVSQYLIRHVIYRGEQSPKEIFFRTLLFKIFNKIDTWELLVRHFGLPNSAEFNVERYSQVLAREIESGKPIYSAAYIMPSSPKSSHYDRKHHFHLSLLAQMLADNLPDRIVDAQSLQGTYDLLLAFPSIGPFLAFQFTIDLNYSDILQASEMEFVVPGAARDSTASPRSNRVPRLGFFHDRLQWPHPQACKAAHRGRYRTTVSTDRSDRHCPFANRSDLLHNQHRTGCFENTES